MELYAYTRSHFEAEEAQMRAHLAADYLSHRDQHDVLLTRLTELTQQLRDSPDSLADLKTFVAEWVIGHLLEQDRKLG
jgi:hemerythrin-like metal-binding protein